MSNLRTTCLCAILLAAGSQLTQGQIGWRQFERNKQNLLLSLPFDEGHGDTTRDDISGKSATVCNAEWIAGSSSSLRFSGMAEQTLSLADPSPERGEFTIEAWCKQEEHDGGYLVLKKYAFGFPCFAGDGKVNAYIRRSDDKDWGVVIPNMVEVGVWQHYVLTCDGKTVSIYRNGELRMTRALPVAPANSDRPVLIGASGGWGEKNFIGELGLLRIYNAVLTHEEIQKEYRALKEKKASNEFASVTIQVPELLKTPKEGDSALELNGRTSFVETVPSTALDPANALTVGAWIRPERAAQGNIDEQKCIVSKGGDDRGGYMLTTYHQNGLAAVVVTDEGPFTATAADVLRKGQWQHAAFSWGSNILQIFVDGLPVGKAVLTRGRLKPYKGPLHIGKAADREAHHYHGGIDEVKVFNAAFGMELMAGVGQQVIAPASSTDPSGVVQACSSFLAGLKEQHAPLVDFEDLTGWSVTTYKGFSEAQLFRSQEKRLWGDYVAKLVFRAGNVETQDKEKKAIIIRPPMPILIERPFDAISLWVYGKYYYRPGGFTVSLQLKDNKGEAHSVIMNGRLGPHSNIHRVFWSGWSIVHKVLPEKITPPAKFISLTFYDIIGDAEQTTYLDSLAFHTADQGPIPSNIPAWNELAFPTTPDTILPSLSNGVTYANSVRQERDHVSLLYKGNDETIEYQYKPVKGTLSDITVIHNDSFIFKPLLGGGLVLDINGEEYSPDDARVQKKLENITVNDSSVNTTWRYEVADQSFKTEIVLLLKQKSLVVNIRADTDAVTEVRMGSSSGTPGAKLVEVPYLVIGGGMHPSEDPAILYTNGIFLSAFVDWYNSEASELFGQKQVLSDDAALYNGGAAYFPTTKGKRNPPRERIFVTASTRFAEVLPNIPNPPSPFLDMTKKKVWASQQWNLDKEAYTDIVEGKAPPYYEQQYAFWKKIKSYGVDDLIVHFWFGGFHTGVHESDTNDGFPESSYVSEDPRLGGNAAVREFVRKLRDEIGYLAAPYTNYTIMAPLNYRYWDENMICLYPNRAWKYGSGPSYLIKPSRTLDVQAYFNARLEENFNPNVSYGDQYTARTPWRCTDYDSRAPEAGKFAPVIRVYGELLNRQREQFGGPVFSEGLTQWLFVGLCDGNYGMLPTINQPVLVDFRVLKLNPLTNDFGFHLRHYAGGDLHWWVASEIAYGNIGMVYGRSWLRPHDQRIAELLKSYFMIQQLQQCYATTPVERIGYDDNGRVVTIEEAIKTDAHKNNRVYLKYENGLEVYVNRNAKDNWTVILNGTEYVLPPNGYACESPGVILEYSALSDGKRVDYVRGQQYLYCDGGGTEMDFGVVKAAQSYVLRFEEGRIWLIPAPFRIEDTVVLTLGQLGATAGAETKVIACDEAGKRLGPAKFNVADEKLRVHIVPGVFKYWVDRN